MTRIVEKWLWESRDVLVVVGTFTQLLQEHEAYQERHGIPPEQKPRASADLERLLIGVALAHSVGQEGESLGWSLKLPGSDYGLFAATEPEGMTCGRVIRTGSPAKKPIVVVQTARAYSPTTQSSVTPSSGDPIEGIEDYFSDAKQIATRILIDESAQRGLLLQALPGGKFADLELMPADEVFRTIDAALEAKEMTRLNETVMFYACRCNDEMILNVFMSLPAAQRTELTDETGSVSIECPRCGRSYTIKNAAFEGGADKKG